MKEEEKGKNHWKQLKTVKGNRPKTEARSERIRPFFIEGEKRSESLVKPGSSDERRRSPG